MTTVPVPLKLAKSIAGQLVFVPGRTAKRGLNELVGLILDAEAAPLPLPLLETETQPPGQSPPKFGGQI